ncbi:MAG: helicase C-terminal domain-containing protein [bacterium]
MKQDCSNVFGTNGVIANRLKTYEYRPQQLEMSKRIEQAISNANHLIVEAGTGTGKSLSYLVPFIYWAVEEEKKVAVSTYTKTLQEQLITQDLPFLKKALGVNFNFALCVGSNNYLCLRRFFQTQTQGLFESSQEIKEFKKISAWENKTQNGLKSELLFEPSTGVWSKICRESDLCMSKKCAHFNDCYYYKAKKKQYHAQVLVVNHHLFFANIASAEQVLPQFDAVVFDEAHNLEDVATNYLGAEVSNSQIKFLIDTIYNPTTDKGILTRIKGQEELKEKVKKTLIEVGNAADRFFGELLLKFGSQQVNLVVRIREANFIDNYLDEPLDALISNLGNLKSKISDEETQLEVLAFQTRTQAIKDALKIIISQPELDYVYWIEIIQRHRFIKIILHANPIDIAEDLKNAVFDSFDTVVLTSATLTTNNSFEYIKSRLGCNGCDELQLSSPFDFQSQVLLFLPTGIPDPKLEPEKYHSCIAAIIEELLEVMQGRTFVLFTSFAMLRKISEEVETKLAKFSHFKQGEFSSQRMIEEFKSTKNSVLWGTNTFWQGVDVPGEDLECVVITKLPFAVPDDPIVEARMEYLRAKGSDPFWAYQVPQAIIQTRQGFGRLIRRKDDIGVVAILDPRVKTKGYGRLFLNSLPKCQQAYNLNQVKKFYQTKKDSTLTKF